MTIYITEFDPDTLQCTSLSVDSGFESLTDTVVAFGIPKNMPTSRIVLYHGILFSDFPYHAGYH